MIISPCLDSKGAQEVRGTVVIIISCTCRPGNHTPQPATCQQLPFPPGIKSRPLAVASEALCGLAYPQNLPLTHLLAMAVSYTRPLSVLHTNQASSRFRPFAHAVLPAWNSLPPPRLFYSEHLAPAESLIIYWLIFEERFLP